MTFGPFGRNKREQDLRDELESHVRMAAGDRQERGQSSDEANAAARRELGNMGMIEEVTHETWGWGWLTRFLQDLRYGMRVMRRNSVSTAVSILTLTLGIGASTAIFSVVYGVLLRPLAFEKPEQLVQVWEVDGKGNQMALADPNFADFRAQAHSLQGLAEFSSWTESVSGGSEPRRLTVATVSQDFFPVMRAKPAIGRSFKADDQRAGAAPVVLVSYNFWQQYLNATRDLSKLKLNVGNKSSFVAGVLPEGFHFPDDADVWMPRELEPPLPSRSAHNWKAVGRLRDDAMVDRAHAELSGIAQQIKQQYGQEVDLSSAVAIPLRDAITGDVRPRLVILLVAVAFLLLVGCANVMNLLLAQASAREGELAVRAALGASRGRLIRQFLAEALLLALSGGALGVLASYFGVRLLVAAAPANTPRLSEVSVQWPVLLFALGVSIVVATTLGVFTALRATSHDVRSSLAEGGRSQAGAAASQKLGRLIIAGQLAITLVLLVGAGLMGRSLLRVLSIDPGFRTEQVLTMDLAMSGALEPAQKVQRTQFMNELFNRLRAVPGVQDVGATNALPLGTGVSSNGTFVVMNPSQIDPATLELINRSGHESFENNPKLMKDPISFLQSLFRDPTRTGDADYVVASEGYFRTLDIPLKSGRMFDDRDSADAPHAALVSESLVRQKWLNEDPLGRSIEFGNMDTDLRLLTIVGVVGDVRERSMEGAPRPTIYVNYRQRPQSTSHLSIVMRSSLDASVILPQAQRIVRELDPQVPPTFSTFSRVIANSLNTRRFNLILVGIFAVAATLLAIAGIYGVMAYSVTRRTREIGVRIALGATTGNVLRLVLRQAMLTAAAGVSIGVVFAFALTRLMRAVLFEISSTDPLTYVAVAVLLLAVALLAAYLPARRATQVDPLVALRYE